MCAAWGRARKAGCAYELVCLDTELSLLGALLLSRCCWFWCLFCHGACSPQSRGRQWTGWAQGNAGQSPSEPSAAQRALKQLLLQATYVFGVYLDSLLLLPMALLQLHPATSGVGVQAVSHQPAWMWAAFLGPMEWDAEGGDAGCLLTLS